MLSVISGLTILKELNSGSEVVFEDKIFRGNYVCTLKVPVTNIEEVKFPETLTRIGNKIYDLEEDIVVCRLELI
ncbi:MAG TPA: hypothetical protein IAD08_07005 [Candidatus Scatovivens faecipullorum]|nr:hypothetical protein [Candidatus Scatovivens faecipullorum]